MSVLMAAAALCAVAAASAGEGVVVTRVRPGLAAEKGGLQPGDPLARWEQGEASGALTSPFDLAEVELEYGPRGPVRLLGARGEEPLTVSLFPDAWGLDTRPDLPEDVAAAMAAAQSKVDAGAIDAGLAGLEALRPRLRALALPDLEPWVLTLVARAEEGRKRTDAAVAAIEEAATAARASGRGHVEAQVLAQLGAAFRAADRNPEAAAAFERALAVRRRMGPDGVATASLADPIGNVAHALGRGEEEPRKFVAALAAVHERLAHESLAFARTLLTLGRLQRRRADAVEPYGRALALTERLAPGTLHVARALAHAAVTEGDIGRRSALLGRALAIQEKLDPRSTDTAVVLIRLAVALELMGEPGRALEHHQRALALVERVAPGTESHGQVLNAFGGYWSDRGDLVQAEALLRQALEIDERRRPGTEWVAVRLYNLGEVLRIRRDLAQSEAYLRRAMTLSEMLSPRGELSGRILHTLGRTVHERGDDAAAEPLLRRSLEILAETSPGQMQFARETLAAIFAAAGRREEAAVLYRQNLDHALTTTQSLYVLPEAHHRLGDLALAGGDLETAEGHHRSALDLRRQAVPDTIWHAESAHALGVVQRRRGRRENALALFQEAVGALEAQGRRLGGSEETRTGFRSHYQEYYLDLEELLLDLGRTVDAFEVMERSRARGLAALLASRDIGLDGHLPAELERERRLADSAHDRLFRSANEGGLDEARRAALRAELDVARRRQDEVRSRIRAALPRLAALRDPEPLDLPGVRRVLDPGTLLLAFSLGATAGRVYAVGPGPDEFSLHALKVSPGELRDTVVRFRETIESRRSGRLRGPVAIQSRRLTELLLAPVAGLVRRAERIVVVPDGVLHLLPLAALRDPSAAGRFLVESKPVHTVSSATLYQVLVEPWMPGRTTEQVVGFGDPAYGSAAGGRPRDSPALARARSAGLDLAPLPATRREVEALKSLFPSAQVWLGNDATEEKAKTVGPSARVVHFACHGFLDEDLPLESGLALALPREGDGERDNGLLQAWEVFEKVRVDADLVTLSACQTGLGKEMAGEGLLGLTWAFQYAGARSVLASLWEVSDASTADLMKTFYAHLSTGVPKAEALRRAQLALLRRPATAAPYYWAAFTLIGAGR